ncbi:prepilin peptidase [Myxococcota bacterium]|nr:prepilin peptidase [Myxococcota bacterium]
MFRFAAKVRNVGEPLAELGDLEFQDRVEAVWARLGMEGLSPEALVQAFAVIREVARRKLGTPHYDVQLAGGWLMAQGYLAEMQTGEGKTLTATLPACAAAMAGIPVHVISSNDYLVERDAEEMRPIYEGLGLRVGFAIENMDLSDRRKAYACDVTYVTSKVVTFDYLRDRLQSASGRRGLAGRLERIDGRTAGEPALLRGLCFALIDEADSILVDEARTPLIISRPMESTTSRKIFKRALRLAQSLEEGTDFLVDHSSSSVRITPGGRVRLETLAQPLGGVFSGPRRREEWVGRALTACHVYQRDRDYMVADDKVQIVDALTGRASADRSWEQGLHQLIELKEGCTLTTPNESLARISYQQFFRRYLQLGGMTGTAWEVRRELSSTYELESIRVPTRKKNQRHSNGEYVFRSSREKWKYLTRRIRELQDSGRPVLVGTCSIAESEELSDLLHQIGVAHEVLNAKQDAREASIVARAGEMGRVTVATNMAGRGTDIKLSDGIAEQGGLHVIATRRSDSQRVDRQLFGRCGRQGDPGSYELVASLDDENLRIFHRSWMLRGTRSLLWGDAFGAVFSRALLRGPQRAEERRHAHMRRGLDQMEEYLDQILAFSGMRE